MAQHNVPTNMAEAMFSATGKAIYVPELGGVLLAWGPTVPSGVAGYAPNCLFIHTDGSAANARLYVNSNTAASCTFSAFTAAA